MLASRRSCWDGAEVGIVHGGEYSPMDDDPDNFRPSSSWLLHVDPDHRAQLSVIRERIEPEDRIPLHWHDVDEVVLYESGRGLAHLDGTDTEVGPGASVFIPAGVIHGTVNIGIAPLEIRATPRRSCAWTWCSATLGPGPRTSRQR